ncbi:hypothetical protein [Amaricoccus sp.]|uniref:hypothetical protein n=1 Tax=Amaricoccus sp. TaxID=1872485 RepID=UPI002605EA8F|nr:hypothetical protein [uncultured Amaricoccus sp.]
MTYDPIQANQPILREIADFCAANAMTKTAFGLGVMNDRAFVTDLENGRQLTQRLMFRLRAVLDGAGADQVAGAVPPKKGAA